MYILNTQVGDIVPIYLDYINDQDFEGEGKLIEFVEEGYTFYEDDDFLEVDPNEAYSSLADINNEEYLKLEEIFSFNNGSVKKTRSELMRLTKKDPAYIIKFDAYLNQVHEQFEKTPSSLSLLKYIGNKKIAYYFRYKKYGTRQQMLFFYQKWLVEIQPSSQFEKPIRTIRKIKILKSMTATLTKIGVQRLAKLIEEASEQQEKVEISWMPAMCTDYTPQSLRQMADNIHEMVQTVPIKNQSPAKFFQNFQTWLKSKKRNGIFTIPPEHLNSGSFALTGNIPLYNQKGEFKSVRLRSILEIKIGDVVYTV